MVNIFVWFQRANNIGTQGGPPSFWSEGGPLSESLNKFGGINAVAGLHDVFQINLKGNLRDILNVPGMPIAAAITYLSLYPNVQCPMCSELKWNDSMCSDDLIIINI